MHNGKYSAEDVTKVEDQVNESRQAYNRSVDASSELPRSQAGKTTASNGGSTVSGYSDNRISNRTRNNIENATGRPVTDVSPDDVRAAAPDHTMRENSSIDNGNAGSAAASHAEKQSMANGSNEVGVSRDMCTDCKDYAQSRANHTGDVVVVTDPKGSHIFVPGKDKPIDIGFDDVEDFDLGSLLN